eukprot:scaffold96455_cov24-Tisochrysis_lutea.AAC.1
MAAREERSGEGRRRKRKERERGKVSRAGGTRRKRKIEIRLFAHCGVGVGGSRSVRERIYGINCLSKRSLLRAAAAPASQLHLKIKFLESLS